MSDWIPSLASGIATYVEVSKDNSDLKEAALIYRPLEGFFRDALAEDAECLLAFPSLIIRPDSQAPCLVVVTEDSVVIAWRRGFLRSKIESLVLDSADIEKVVWGRGSVAQYELTVQGKLSATFALPQRNPQVGDLIKGAIERSMEAARS